jgi:predicted amidohydrolase YtcJ
MKEYTHKPSPAVLVKSADVFGDIMDVRFDGHIIALHEPGAEDQPQSSSELEVIEANGRALLPSLHDHHIHLRGLAAVRASLDVGPHEVSSVDALLKLIDQQPGEGWLRCTGYHESTLGELTGDDLAAIGRPLRIEHRSGKLWVLNPTAMRALEVESCDHPGVERNAQGHATGRLFRMDRWLAERIESLPLALPELGQLLASFGITEVTDASHTNQLADHQALAAGLAPIRVHCLGEMSVGGGALKIMLDEDALPDVDELNARIRGAHDQDRGVAFHCVSRTELVLALSALAATGHHQGDRIEHGALIAEDLFEMLKDSSCPVITQPGFIYARGDQYVEEVEELEDLYRFKTLIDAGIRVLASSDAPYGPLDPWLCMATAVGRRTAAGCLLGENERVSPEQALSGYLRSEPRASIRQIVAGAPASLCLLDRSWVDASRDLACVNVVATWQDGVQIYGGDRSQNLLP